MIKISGLEERNLQFEWNAKSNEIASVPLDEFVCLDIPDSSTLQIKEDSDVSVLTKLDPSKYDAAVGPIKVEGVTKGDTLMVEIVKVNTWRWGWTSISPSFGLLKGRFGDHLIHWDIGLSHAVSRNRFLSGIKIPVRPFLGVVSTLPGKGRYAMIPPRQFGGNMDNRLLTVGSILYLPVNVDGAMVSFGDPHAAQGDGEVCGTAIETGAEVTVRFRVIKNQSVKYPRAMIPAFGEGICILTTGISRSLRKAALIAIEEMIDDITRTTGLSEEEAYALCSVAGNLKISEIVDEPNYVVSLTLPKSLLYH